MKLSIAKDVYAFKLDPKLLTAAVYGYKGVSKKHIFIPSEIGKYKVIEVGHIQDRQKRKYNWFDVEQIILPESIRTVKLSAFNGCHKLTNISLPQSIEKIEMLAFAYCEALEYVYFPKNTVEIGDAAFLGCRNLKTVVVPETIRKIGRAAFPENTEIMFY